MSVQVTVALVDDELVAVKRATTPAASARLRAEGARLAQAIHPGVVALVGRQQVDGDEELLLGYAGEPLDGWRGRLPQVAGLVAALAATLADLHELGIVHGRIDASHVLVGPDGRPRLCGLSGPADATAADDVLAVGRLLDALADHALQPRRPRRRGGAERRALARVVARATDPDPRRRPSARTLSTSILAAVPAARLSPAAGSPAPARAPHLHEIWDSLALSRRAAGDAPAPTPDPTDDAATAAPRGDGSGPPAAPAGPLRAIDVAPDARPTGPARVPRCSESAGSRPAHSEQRGTSAGREAGCTDDGGPPTEGLRPVGGDGPALRLGPVEHDPWAWLGGSRPADDSDLGEATAAPGTDTKDPSAATAAPATDTKDPSAATAAPATNAQDPSAATAAPGTDTEGGSALDAWLAWSVSAGLERPQPRPEADEPSQRHGGPAEPGRPAVLAGPVPLPRLGNSRRPGRNAKPAPGGPSLTGCRAEPAPPGPALTGRGAEPAAGGPSLTGDRAEPAQPRPGRGAEPVPAGPSVAGDPGGCGVAPIGTTGDPGPRRDDPPAPLGADARAALGADPHQRAGADGEGRARPMPGAGRPRRGPGRGARRGRRRAAGMTAAGVVGVGLVAAGLVATAGGQRAGLDVAEPPRRDGACPEAPQPAADVDGDGCPEALAVEGNRVSAGDATWELGRPGDVVAVGDWDCDGSASSALLRPATGDVFVFPGWSAAGEPVTVTPTRSVPGGTGLRVDEVAGGCDALVVELAGGSESVVAEARA